MLRLNTKIIRTRHYLILGAGGILLFSGLYLLLLSYAPALPIFETSPLAVQAQTSAALQSDHISIEKLGLSVPFSAGETDEVLKQGAWHRYPERGDPEKGGNFILSAHRFRLSATPQATRESSPFYNLDRLRPGDVITAHFHGQDYTYHVVKTFEVKPYETWIEAPTDNAQLTLYSCTLGGPDDGRLVVIAQPV